MHPNLGPGPNEPTYEEIRLAQALSDRFDEMVNELLAENGPGSDEFCIRQAHRIVYGFDYPYPLDETVRVVNALKLSDYRSAQEVRDAIAGVRQRIADTKRDYIRTALNSPTADQYCSHLYASLTDLLRIWRNEFPEDYTQAQAAKDHELLQARLERAALQVERTELRLLEVGAKLQNPNDRMPWLTALEYQCAQDNVDAAHRDFRSIAQSVTSSVALDDSAAARKAGGVAVPFPKERAA